MARIQLAVTLSDELMPCSASLFADSGVWSPVSPPRKGARLRSSLPQVFSDLRCSVLVAIKRTFVYGLARS
jgi:hypothetical protein